MTDEKNDEEARTAMADRQDEEKIIFELVRASQGLESTLYHRAAVRMMALENFVRLYRSTYDQTDIHPTAGMEAEVITAARRLISS